MPAVINWPARWDVIVVPCGGRKRASAAPASRLYTGPYFTACLRTAYAIPHVHTRILSGKHGLIEPERILEPYEQRIDGRGAVSVDTVRAQAVAQGLIGARRVLILCGSAYVRILRRIWPTADAPLHGGIGQQLQQLRTMRSRWLQPSDFDWQ